MHQITILRKSGDRVITSARINSGQETLAGLDDGQSLEVMMGRTVVLPRPGYSEAIVELHTRWGSWEYKGPEEGLPHLDGLPDDEARKVALDAWCKSSILLASYA